MSKKIPINLNDQQRDASEDVTLRYPFDLTTDSLAYGIGSFLSQDKKTVTMISRNLKDCETRYATILYSLYSGL